ncbi:hypothetical protein [Streptomyces marincola]|uniref:Lipoprotein n=1 Tax=Streptomyces marincola TaxID=2878388 RepID=A0A1W7D4B7_9ACTN|nr:hypothetical protein [Streptomyces marincola]ARQ71866.1 hypothetical protein CAG99_26260 [Streptomyces marincola]
MTTRGRATTAAVFAVLALAPAAAGCAAGGDGDAAAGRGTAAAGDSARQEAAGAWDVAACLDSDCRVRVRKGTRIPLDGRYGADAAVVQEITSGSLSLAVQGGRENGSFTAAVATVPCAASECGAVPLRGPASPRDHLGLVVVSVDDGTAEIILSPPGAP